MNRDHHEYLRNHAPDLAGVYKEYMSEENVNLIGEMVSKMVKERYPSHSTYKVARESIKNAMWEVFTKEHNHPQIMIQMVINLIVQQIFIEKETEDVSHYNPRIMNNPELFGITSYNSSIIKLNNKRIEPIQFTNPW